MKKIRVTSRMTSTDGGAWGAVLFVLAPIVSGFVWSWYVAGLAELARDRFARPISAQVAPLLLFVAGFVWLVSILLVFYGRTYTHEIESVDAGAEAPQEPAGSAGGDGETPFPSGRVRPGSGAF